MKINYKRTRKNKKNSNKNNMNNKSRDDNDDINMRNIKKITIKDDIGCITVNNSFEENFDNYFKKKKNAHQ